jgi:LmbE family N-acetylglucosaminyl deacetylase
MAERFTFMAGHGHPDDECRRTGGVLVRYARAGIRTVSHVPVDGPADDLLAGLRAVL